MLEVGRVRREDEFSSRKWDISEGKRKGYLSESVTSFSGSHNSLFGCFFPLSGSHFPFYASKREGASRWNHLGSIQGGSKLYNSCYPADMI